MREVADRLAQETTGSKATGEEIQARLRWEAPSDGSKIKIMRRGSKKKGESNVVAVISKTGKYSDLYPTWEQALRERGALQVATGSKRVSHKTINAGLLPDKELPQ